MALPKRLLLVLLVVFATIAVTWCQNDDAEANDGFVSTSQTEPEEIVLARHKRIKQRGTHMSQYEREPYTSDSAKHKRDHNSQGRYRDQYKDQHKEGYENKQAPPKGYDTYEGSDNKPPKGSEHYKQGSRKRPHHREEAPPKDPDNYQEAPPKDPEYYHGAPPKGPEYHRQAPPKDSEYYEKEPPQKTDYHHRAPPQDPDYYQDTTPKDPRYHQETPTKDPQYDQEVPARDPWFDQEVPLKDPQFDEETPAEGVLIPKPEAPAAPAQGVLTPQPQAPAAPAEQVLTPQPQAPAAPAEGVLIPQPQAPAAPAEGVLIPQPHATAAPPMDPVKAPSKAASPIVAQAPVAHPWSLGQCKEARNNTMQMTLVSLSDKQAFSGHTQKTCFAISKPEGSSCAAEASQTMRMAFPIDINACGRSTVKSVKWSLDGQPLPVGVYWDQGYAITDELGAWSAPTKQLCADVDTSGRPLKCSSLEDLVPGQGLAYRLLSTNAACCFEGVAEDRVSVAGELVLDKIDSDRTRVLASIEASYADALSKAALLKKAVMNFDFATAPAVLQQSNAAEVLALTEMPAAWPSTADQPSKLALNPALYNYKDQGPTTMDTSYAVIAALEGAVDAAKNAPKATTNLSEKALHWCDAAKTVGPITAADGRVDAPTNGGWHTENAFDTLAAQGAVAAGCFGEQPGVMYSSDLVGTLGGQCMLKTGLLKCSRTKAFAKKSWTPATAADIIEIQNHIMENRAVATYLNMHEKMLESLDNTKGDATSDQVQTHVQGDALKWGHAVSVVGWDFSSPNQKDHYWIIKDSMPKLGDAFGQPQLWKLARSSASDVGFFNFAGGYFVPGAKKAPEPEAPIPADQVTIKDGCQAVITGPCTSFIQAYKAASTKAVLPPMSKAFVSNLEKMAGKDFQCLPANVTLTFCAPKGNV